MNLNLLPNIFAFIAVILYVLTLFPSLLVYVKVEWGHSRFNHKLMQNRRTIGLLAFAFGLFHGVSIIITRQINFAEPATYIKALA